MCGSAVPLMQSLSTEARGVELIGQSSALRTVLEQIRLVAKTDATVLILGETGTGKELIARRIHSMSSRAHRPFVKVNCAAMPFDLLESELFGHERGAFTGAVAQRPSRFEVAHGGTLFLDEIGDMPLASQPKLLRVLQEGEFERVGSSRTQHVDVRLLAATHRDLRAMARNSEFRGDPYYRLNVFPVTPPRCANVARTSSHASGISSSYSPAGWERKSPQFRRKDCFACSHMTGQEISVNFRTSWNAQSSCPRTAFSPIWEIRFTTTGSPTPSRVQTADTASAIRS